MLFLSLSAAILSAADPGCGTALAAAPAYSRCAQGGAGVAISADQAEADALLAYAESAEPRFIRHFPTAIRPYVVLYFDQAAPVAELQTAGFPTVLAWASPQKIGQLLGETLRQNARGPDNVPLSAEAEAGVQAQMALLTRGIIDMQDGVISHEVAHLWYRDAYWKDSRQPRDGYGTPAPDWLDETAAILCETEGMAVKRRKTFLDAWAAAGAENRYVPGGIGDLGHVLQRSHPSQATPSRAPSLTGEQAVVTVRPKSGDRDLFYSQVRSFSDFLIDTSGDPEVFARITEALVEGRSFEQWLADQPSYATIPRDVPELQHQWSVWIEKQLAANGPAPAAAAN